MGDIKHEWSGTILTITSDSGVSASDLKGEKGDKGCRGPQGPAGVIVDSLGNITWPGYATEEYVNYMVDNAELNVDLTNFYTKEEVANTIVASCKQVEEDLENQVKLVDAKLDDYATKEYVGDLDRFATVDYVNEGLASVEVDLTGYATEEYVGDQIELNKIPNTATEEFVVAEIAKAQLEGAGVDTSGFATTDAMPIIKGNGNASAAIGNKNKAAAAGNYAIAAGFDCSASKDAAVALCYSAQANAIGSLAAGFHTTANSKYQTAIGKYNKKDSDDNYALIVGNGESGSLSNAATITWEGDAHFAGDVYVRGANTYSSGTKLATQTSIDSINTRISELHVESTEFEEDIAGVWQVRSWDTGEVELYTAAKVRATNITGLYYKCTFTLPFEVYSPVIDCNIDSNDDFAYIASCTYNGEFSATKITCVFSSVTNRARIHVRITGSKTPKLTYAEVTDHDTGYGPESKWFPFEPGQTWKQAIDNITKYVGVNQMWYYDLGLNIVYYERVIPFTVCGGFEVTDDAEKTKNPIRPTDVIKDTDYWFWDGLLSNE